MEAEQPYEGNEDDDHNRVTIDELRRQLAAYAPAISDRANDLPADLRVEAEALALHLADDPDLYAGYFSDLVRNGATLSAEDCIAAWYAFDLASEHVNAGRVVG